MTRVGVCLAGCGFLDGAEIRESVLTLLSLSRAGAEAVCFAPDREQLHVVDHLRGEPVEGEARNVLVESARIARGEIVALDDFDLSSVDALVFPGGFGVAKNLCDFALRGAECEVLPEVQELIRAARAAERLLRGAQFPEHAVGIGHARSIGQRDSARLPGSELMGSRR